MTLTERRVLFIGDSFATPGAAACLQEELGSYGRSIGRAYAVTLAGYPGQGLTHFLPDVRHKVRELKPDIVIHVYPDTDANRHYSLLKRLVFPTPRLATKGWARGFRLSKRIKQYSPILGDLVWRMLLATVLREVDIRDGLKRDLRLFREFTEFLKEAECAYVVCLWDVELYGLTNRFREALKRLDGYDHATYLADLNEYLALFHPSQYQIPNDGHPNDLGNRLMARYIVEKASAAGVI